MKIIPNISLILFLTIGMVGCAGVTIPDFKAHVTLPASGDGYWVKTVSEDEGRIPKKEWDVLKKRGITILSEDWAIFRNTTLKNCLTNECKDVIGIFDQLFYSLDSALQQTK